MLAKTDQVQNLMRSCRKFQDPHFTVASLLCGLSLKLDLFGLLSFFLLAAGDLKFKTHTTRALEGCGKKKSFCLPVIETDGDLMPPNDSSVAPAYSSPHRLHLSC